LRQNAAGRNQCVEFQPGRLASLCPGRIYYKEDEIQIIKRPCKTRTTEYGDTSSGSRSTACNVRERSKARLFHARSSSIISDHLGTSCEKPTFRQQNRLQISRSVQGETHIASECEMQEGAGAQLRKGRLGPVPGQQSIQVLQDE